MRATSFFGFSFGVADDGVSGDAVGHWWQAGGFTTVAHVGDLLADDLGRVTVHEVGVAFAGDEILGGL